MVQRFKETGHRVFTSASALSRGNLRMLKGKETIHFNADASNTEPLFRIIHCVNQLSTGCCVELVLFHWVCGNKSTCCNPLPFCESQVHGCFFALLLVLVLLTQSDPPSWHHFSDAVWMRTPFGGKDYKHSWSRLSENTFCVAHLSQLGDILFLRLDGLLALSGRFLLQLAEGMKCSVLDNVPEVTVGDYGTVFDPRREHVERARLQVSERKFCERDHAVVCARQREAECRRKCRVGERFYGFSLREWTLQELSQVPLHITGKWTMIGIQSPTSGRWFASL